MWPPCSLGAPQTTPHEACVFAHLREQELGVSSKLPPALKSRPVHNTPHVHSSVAPEEIRGALALETNQRIQPRLKIGAGAFTRL